MAHSLLSDAVKQAQYDADAFKRYTKVVRQVNGQYRVDDECRKGERVVRTYEPDYD